MIQKKICMVGVFATGKTSLVRRFVESIFSDRYLSTVGVKIDRKHVDIDGTDVKLLLWDIEGRSETERLRTSYLQGAAGILLVVDGTRPQTYAQMFDLQREAEAALGSIPCAIALNKHDLTHDWCLSQPDYDRLQDEGWRSFLTSAKTGQGVEEAFRWLAAATLGKR